MLQVQEEDEPPETTTKSPVDEEVKVTSETYDDYEPENGDYNENDYSQTYEDEEANGDYERLCQILLAS